MHPDDRSPVEAALADCLELGLPFDQDYGIIRRSDGQTRWLRGMAGDGPLGLEVARQMPHGLPEQRPPLVPLLLDAAGQADQAEDRKAFGKYWAGRS